MDKILIAEDDSLLRKNLTELLINNNYEVIEAIDGEDTITKVITHKPLLVLLDVNMPKMNGLECLTQIKAFDSSIIVIILTAYSSIEDAILATKEGAYNYLSKPIKFSSLIEMLDSALKAKKMISDIAFSSPIVKFDDMEIIGSSHEMQKLYSIIYKLAKVDTAVLIRGESGTGKELVARAIHYNSARKNSKFIAINCSAISESLFESEFFGHERGAFTGADKRQIGKLQYAEDGTLFLDEIGDLSLSMQVKLLRVLQEKKFMPVGSNREIELNARIISATNRNLEKMIQEGSFREDLFYRLNVIPVFLPPLIDRKNDIEKLINHFIDTYNMSHKRNILGVAPSTMQILMSYSWPGNIRELENVIEHAVVLENGSYITASALPKYLLKHFFPTQITTASSAPNLDYKSIKENFEKDFIISVLKANKGKINKSAEFAKIPKKTLLRKIEKYNIQVEHYR